MSYVNAGAEGLPTRAGGFDVVASGLVLNFIPNPEAALLAMRERTRSGGKLTAYVWDYARVEFLQTFWPAAVALDAGAAALDESRRFGRWQQAQLSSLFSGAGLLGVEVSAIEIATQFADFADYWEPFLGATGPAPSYVGSLDAARRELLRERLRERLTAGPSGEIGLTARAWGVRGTSP